MATFTMPLKRAIEVSGGVLTLVNGQSVMTGGNIGLNDYPIFDDDYRDVLNGKIIDRYMNREIGQETVSMFQLAMRRKMNEIMPFYNKLYLTEQIAYDPLSTIDIRTISNAATNQNGQSTGTSEATTNATGGSRSVNSETPQTQLSGNGDYATSASDVNSTSANESNANQTSNEIQESESETESNTTGYQGVASDLVMRYRESLLNIDLSVLGELEELFMLVWDNGDNYTNTKGFYPWF